MPSLRNASGRPLSSPQWLEAHHRAKLPERRAFARALAARQPSVVVDIGCATGLWLDVLDEVLSDGCELVGIDSDTDALSAAQLRASGWQHRAQFYEMDVERDPSGIPHADLAMAFNVFPYLSDPARLLGHLHDKAGIRCVAVRQYDGATMRIGPMSESDRGLVDGALRASTGSSAEFHHYDMDRTLQALFDSPYRSRSMQFELTQRFAPFPPDFVEYFDGTVEWVAEHISEVARERFEAAVTRASTEATLYFCEVDLKQLFAKPLDQGVRLMAEVQNGRSASRRVRSAPHV